jgi:hypothetical protein
MSKQQNEAASASAREPMPIRYWLGLGGLAAFPWLVFAMAPGLDSNQEVVFGLLATAAFIFALVIMFGLVFANEFSDTGRYEPGWSAFGIVACCFAAVVGWFAALYVQISADDHGWFMDSSKTTHQHVLGHADAAYFTILTFTTAGTGNISPTGEASRLIVSGQSLLGLTIIAFLIAGLASRMLES